MNENRDVTEDLRSQRKGSESTVSGSEWKDIERAYNLPSSLNDPRTVPWDLSISVTDFEKFTADYNPNGMEGEWAFTVDDPGPNGGIWIQTIRVFSWREVWALQLKQGGDRSGPKAEAITWGGTRDYDEEEAKREAVQKCRVILGCDFDELPKYRRRDDDGRLEVLV